MIQWEVIGETIYVTDTDNTEIAVNGSDLAVEGLPQSLSKPVDSSVSVTASELQFPNAAVYAFGQEKKWRYELNHTGDQISLPFGNYLVDIDAEIKSYLRFTGRATIRKHPGCSRIQIRFPTATGLTLGFRSRNELPTQTVSIPQTPAGVATAVSHLSVAHHTTGPDRTYPTLRSHPPLLEFGDEVSIPPTVQKEKSDTGIELVVPPTYESVFVTAPLAYYLQANVRTEPGVKPQLSLPGVNRVHSLSLLPTLEQDVQRLLRKTFFLDSLVRNAGPYRTTLSELSLLEALELDASGLYDATPQQRLETYLDVPDAAIGHRLPDWGLGTSLKPVAENARTLPFLLDQLSLIYLPQTSELDGKELVERSLDDFYRSPASGEVAAVKMVKPQSQIGKLHGWLADGVPIDVFKSTPEAYYNRLEFLTNCDETTSICVVLNDDSMAGEHTDVAEIYQQRGEELSIDVEIKQDLKTASLAHVFESSWNFIHFIGHCETDGLRCPDGNLSMTCIDRSHVETFFLNACGSFYEGMELIEKGSVAGAVTLSKVLNEHAVKVGSTFAKLLSYGFSIERAMQLARRRIMMGKDYAVVGDGTHRLTQGKHPVPTTAELETLKNGQYVLTLESFSTREAGSYYMPPVPENDLSYLCGTDSTFILSDEQIQSFLDSSQLPVIYDGDLYWSQELVDQFCR